MKLSLVYVSMLVNVAVILVLVMQSFLEETVSRQTS